MKQHKKVQASWYGLAVMLSLEQVLCWLCRCYLRLVCELCVLQDFWDIEDEEWLTTFNVNVMSNVRLSRHFLKPMLDRNQVPPPCPATPHSVTFSPSSCARHIFTHLPRATPPPTSLGCSWLQLLLACALTNMQGGHAVMQA